MKVSNNVYTYERRSILYHASHIFILRCNIRQISKNIINFINHKLMFKRNMTLNYNEQEY